MHELGVVMEVVKTVSALCAEEGIKRVDFIVLQIGEISTVVPKFIEECYPAAVDRTFLEGTSLVIETIPANALCRDCNKAYRVLENPNDDKNICPNCGSDKTELLSGREFNIKEITVPED